MGLGLSHVEAMGISIIGNMMPVPFIILFIRPIFRWMTKKAENSAASPSACRPRPRKMGQDTQVPVLRADAVRRHSPAGTGAWTGALIAAVMNMRLRNALPSILLGVMLAGVLVTGLTYGFTSVLLNKQARRPAGYTEGWRVVLENLALRRRRGTRGGVPLVAQGFAAAARALRQKLAAGAPAAHKRPDPRWRERSAPWSGCGETARSNAPIVVEDCGMDEETRQTARLASRRWDCVRLGWDGEEWTNTKEQNEALRPGHKRYLR